MADDKKNGFLAGIGAMFQNKDDEDKKKKKKNMVDQISDRNKKSQAALDDLYNWGKGGN